MKAGPPILTQPEVRAAVLAVKLRDVVKENKLLAKEGEALRRENDELKQVFLDVLQAGTIGLWLDGDLVTPMQVLRAALEKDGR